MLPATHDGSQRSPQPKWLTRGGDAPPLQVEAIEFQHPTDRRDDRALLFLSTESSATGRRLPQQDRKRPTRGSGVTTTYTIDRDQALQQVENNSTIFILRNKRFQGN